MTHSIEVIKKLSDRDIAGNPFLNPPDLGKSYFLAKEELDDLGLSFGVTLIISVPDTQAIQIQLSGEVKDINRLIGDVNYDPPGRTALETASRGVKAARFEIFKLSIENDD